MGLFSRNKGQQDQRPPRGRSPPPKPASIPLYEPVPNASHPRPSTIHPPSGLSKASPQPAPSPPQFQQQLFHQTYQSLQQAQQAQQAQLLHQANNLALGAGGPYTAAAGPYGNSQLSYSPHQNDAAAAAAGGSGSGIATLANDNGTTSATLLRQAIQAAAREGKPLKLDFIAQMQPVMADNPYGVNMPYQHPYWPQTQGNGGPAAAPPDGWRPGPGQDPYDAIRIPALPDMRGLPTELQDFRDQCATGVRQAVAMITAMEHQLCWERSRRQQAEEDCKVLLAAVRMERGVGEALLNDEERRRAEAAEAATKLTLAADQLPQASEAATTIQKHVRGHLARKEFESHLRDILRGVDPSLDPAALPVAAQSHVSHVNTTELPRRLGLRTLLGEVVDKSSAVVVGGPASSALPREQPEAAAYYRRQVDRIGQRLAARKDAGQPHPGDTSDDPLQADVKQLLSGSYPASSAQVIAALVRRCRELQAALLEAVGELQQAQLTIEGLKDANAKVSELSDVRADLEACRHDNLRLVGTIAKLRAALSLQGAGASSGGGGGGVGIARENPFVAAWYRRAYADQEWQRVPPGGPGGVALMDGPDSAVETWDDLRASAPEPVMLPLASVPGSQYRDLLSLKSDMISTAVQSTPDPLYSMPVPDRSRFLYERDTPLVPMQSAAPLIRESVPPDAYLGLHRSPYQTQQQQSPRPSAPGAGTGSLYGAVRGGGDRRGSPRNLSGAGGTYMVAPSPATPWPSTLQQQQQEAAAPMASKILGQQQQQHPEGPFSRAAAAAAAAAAATTAATGASFGVGGRGDGGNGGGRDGGSKSFQYNQDTPVVPVYSVLPLIREDEFVRRSTSPQRECALQQPGTPPLQPQPQPQPQPLHHNQPSGGSTAVAMTTASASRQTPSADMSTNIPFIRDRIQATAPSPSPAVAGVPTEVVAAAAVAATLPYR